MFVRRVSILIPYNSDKKILLQHRTKDAPYLPDYWGFFGGGIAANETPEDTVRREAKEELELEIKEIKLFKRYEIKEENGVYERFAYLLPTSLSARQLREQQKEGDDLDFFTIEEAKKLKFNPYNIAILQDIEDYLNRVHQ